jgi:hypothetical protein
MPLRVEVWDRTPPDDLDEWDEAFEGPLEVDSAGELSFDSPTLLQVRCVVPPGRYRILVVGRGIVAAGWPGSTKPGDSWRVQLSPADGDVPLRRLRSWDPAWQPSDRKATASVGAVATHPWTRRLHTELLAQSPGDPCCRRAESAILLRLMRDIPDAENVVVADQGQIESRLEMLLGDEVERPGLATELGLVDISGRRVRGLPARLMFGERHCVTAVWHGALSVGGQLTFQAKRLQALTWCPNVETALFLVGVGRRIGLPENDDSRADRLRPPRNLYQRWIRLAGDRRRKSNPGGVARAQRLIHQHHARVEKLPDVVIDLFATTRVNRASG